MSERRNSSALTFAKAVDEIQGLLDRLSNEPHEDFEGHGGLCPICGLVSALRASLDEASRAELDAIALRDHVAATPTPPTGAKVTTLGDLAPPKTTAFRKRDGSPLIEITLTHTFSKLTRLRRKP